MLSKDAVENYLSQLDTTDDIDGFRICFVYGPNFVKMINALTISGCTYTLDDQLSFGKIPNTEDIGPVYNVIASGTKDRLRRCLEMLCD